MKTFNGKAMEMKMNHGRTRTRGARGLAAASQFALRAHPTRPLRGGRIYARLGLEGRERKRGASVLVCGLTKGLQRVGIEEKGYDACEVD